MSLVKSRRSSSPYQSRERIRGNERSARSRSPIMSLVRTTHEVGSGSGKVVDDGNKENDFILQSSLDRKTRRHKQYVRESQKMQRQKEGCKLFYVTVDFEGRPYGPGRAAWISEINKLAVGLDASCTDIRKQAHGDICIFKDRLNERFEYSRDLNENYLRGFMGKAVTKRRTDLIDFMNKGGKRLSYFNEDVWKRLEKLADSKQRERRTEHARYANACRRTLGRTCALGEEGVRQRLRDLLQRSPDPEEVATEIQRDKGYGKSKAGTSIERTQSQEGSSDVGFNVMDKNFKSCKSLVRLPSLSEDDDGKQYSPDKSSSQTKEALFRRQIEENKIVRDSGSRRVKETISKDDYIAQLEEELKNMRSNVGIQSRKKPLTLHSGGSVTDDNVGRQRRDGSVPYKVDVERSASRVVMRGGH